MCFWQDCTTVTTHGRSTHNSSCHDTNPWRSRFIIVETNSPSSRRTRSWNLGTIAKSMNVKSSLRDTHFALQISLVPVYIHLPRACDHKKKHGIEKIRTSVSSKWTLTTHWVTTTKRANLSLWAQDTEHKSSANTYPLHYNPLEPSSLGWKQVSVGQDFGNGNGNSLGRDRSENRSRWISAAAQALVHPMNTNMAYTSWISHFPPTGLITKSSKGDILLLVVLGASLIFGHCWNNLAVALRTSSFAMFWPKQLRAEPPKGMK